MIKLLTIGLVLFSGQLALAQELNSPAIIPVDVPPDWLIQVMAWGKTLPYVGPVLVEMLKWLGFTAAMMTALSIVATTILRLPEVIARFAGAPELANRIEFWSSKIIYWIKFFSIFNAKK